jgi:hypothetical protein
VDCPRSLLNSVLDAHVPLGYFLLGDGMPRGIRRGELFPAIVPSTAFANALDIIAPLMRFL